MKKLSYFLLLGLVITACEKEDDTPAVPDLPTYPDLQVYLDRFEQEAKKRGYDFDLSGVEAVYVDEITKSNETFCGYGYKNYDGNGKRRIEISKGCSGIIKDDTFLELLVFHELGHAFFNRNHDETMLCDGTPLSIMSAAENKWTAYGTGSKRDYYISELIDRLSAADECIEYENDWKTDPVYYKDVVQDIAWYFYSANEHYSAFKGTPENSDEYRFSIASVPGKVAAETGYLYKQFDIPNIPQCAKVKLQVTLSSEQLTSPGASIAIRAYHAPAGREGANTEEYLFLTTENDVAINGTFSNETYELQMDCFSRVTDYLIIFVVLQPGTEGELIINDVQLLVEES